MAEEFLSQDEVDALLSGTDDEEAALEPETSAAPEASRSYHVLEREVLRTTPLPAMEAAHERFARQLKFVVSGFVRRPVGIALDHTKVLRYGEFLGSLELPCSFTIVKVNPLRGNALLICEPALVFALIETLFGGVGKLESTLEGREFSATERSVIEAMIRRVGQAYQHAWQDTYPLSLEIVRSENKPQFATVAASDDLVVTTRCVVEINGLSGAFYLCVPNVTLDPIRDSLTATTSKDQLSLEPVWTERLSDQLQVAEIELVTTLAEVDLTFGELINLSVGDFIELDLNEQIEVRVNDVPFMKCRYGTNQGRYAVKVNEFITPTDNLLNGVNHERVA